MNDKKKIFKGKIVILRTKTNSGIIVLDEGDQSDVMTFNPIYDDGDKVEVSFKNNNPKNGIHKIKSVSDEIFYGSIIRFDEQSKSGDLSCNYPRNKGEVPFQISNFLKQHEIDSELFLNNPGIRGVKDFLFGFIERGIDKKVGNRVQFSIHKDDKKEVAYNIKMLKVTNSDIYKCHKPFFGTINKNFFYCENLKTLAVSDKEKGTVKFFDEKKGYGFITKEDGTDFIVHFSSIVSENDFKTLKQDQAVEFEVESDDRGDKAVNVSAIDSLNQNFQKGRVQVRPYFYKNFLIPKGNKIYYMYGLGRKAEIFELNENSKSELIQCFESQNISNEIKLKVINQLLKFDLKHYDISHSSLINKKIELLKQLIEDCQDDNLLKKHTFELIKIDYSLDHIKSFDSGKTKLFSIFNDHVDFDYKSIKSRNWNLTKINDISEDNDIGYNLFKTNWYLGK